MYNNYHGYDASENMPEDFLTSHQAWDDFVSSVWAGVMRDTSMDVNAPSLEIGPGNSTKIAGALASIEFQSSLCILDMNAEALDAVAPKYEAMLPDVNMSWVANSLEEFSPPQGAQLLASHMLDDILVSTAIRLEQNGQEAGRWGAHYTHAPSEHLQALWQKLNDDGALLKAVSDASFEAVKGFIDSMQPQLLIFSQYPSATLGDHGLSCANRAATDLLERLRSHFSDKTIPKGRLQDSLDKNPHYRNAHIGENLLNAGYWWAARWS